MHISSTRTAFALLISLALLACPNTPPVTQGPKGDTGETGATGPAGAPGDVGPKGDTGAKGETGSPGTMGTPGTMGAQGIQGAQGVPGMQGPMGAVLVLDGGIVTGPPGSSVFVTPLPVGGACANGGIRVTQLSDGGTTQVCNGIAGPAGAAGARGSDGAGVTASVLPTMSAQCVAGGVLVRFADGGTSAICNGTNGMNGTNGTNGTNGMNGLPGAQGLQGIQGLTGAQGPQGIPGAPGAAGTAGATGSAGPAGPAGPPGSVFFLDGGAVLLGATTPRFLGFTAATYNGNMGGYQGANAKCQQEFAGSYVCTESEYSRSNAAVPVPASGVWMNRFRDVNGNFYTDPGCILAGARGPWTSSLNADTGFYIPPISGTFTAFRCDSQRPLACCEGAPAILFVGYTAALYNGNMGGYAGANAKCLQEFPQSFVCTEADFSLANSSVPVPSTGVWMNRFRDVNGNFYTDPGCILAGSRGPWTSSLNADTGFYVPPISGAFTAFRCDAQRPLACCRNR
jgi:hypothetical protein